MIFRNRCVVINLKSWSLTITMCYMSIGMRLDGYCFIAEHKWSVNLTGLPSGTILMMRIRNIAGIPDSHRGVHHLISQLIPSDFEVIVYARVKLFGILHYIVLPNGKYCIWTRLLKLRCPWISLQPKNLKSIA